MKTMIARSASAALLCLMLAQSALADTAREFANNVSTGDQKADVLVRLGPPDRAESSRWLGVETELLTYRRGLSELVVIRFVMGHVVGVEVRSRLPWEAE